MRGTLTFDTDRDLCGFQAWMEVVHPEIKQYTVDGPKGGPYRIDLTAAGFQSDISTENKCMVDLANSLRPPDSPEIKL